MRARSMALVLFIGLTAPSIAVGQARPPRLIEESDIYKLTGSTLYVLNPVRGLQIIDLTEPDAPRLIGEAELGGQGESLYVVDSNAYVIVSGRDVQRPLPDSPCAPTRGSEDRLEIVDVADARRPIVRGGINLKGDVVDSRIVGDVLYVVSSRVSWYNRFDYGEKMTTVLSIGVADPTSVHVIDLKEFPEWGWEHHIAVTPNAIYLARSGGPWPCGHRYEAQIQYIDIRDPDGAIHVRGRVEVQGSVMDRWSMDEHEGVLRAASGQFWGNDRGNVYLTTFSVSDPDMPTRLGQYTLHVNERLTSARFDGQNAYLVSSRQIEPLFHFDVSDPAQPRLVGELQMTGWLDFMVPMGDRIVALGHEDLPDEPSPRSISLAVSLVAVSSNAPTLLGRESVGEGWGLVPGERDDFAKVFKVVAEQELVVFPFQSWSRIERRFAGGVQVLDVTRDQIVRRGLIENAGRVERGIPYDPVTILTLSCEVFQVIDISDRDRPQVRARLDLAPAGHQPCPAPVRPDIKSGK